MLAIVRRQKRRIIPADAGSTHGPQSRWSASWDHPRGCGEHQNSGLMLLIRMGSSPRMRGARTKPIIYMSQNGIIPADAGSTIPQAFFKQLVKDHPRGCGEHRVAKSR